MEQNQTLFVRIDGIYCAHCVDRITRTLQALDGVDTVSLRQNVARLSGPSLPSPQALVEAIRGIGYETTEAWISKRRAGVGSTVRWQEFLLIAGVILLLAYGLQRLFGYNIFNAIPTVDSSLSYGMLFLTGLLTSIHCISMCGAIGIFASAESNSVRSLRRPLLYNGGRVLSYTLIGALVGLVGSVFQLNATLRGVVILLSALLMLLMALSMLGLISFHLPQLGFVRRGGARGAFAIGLLNGLMPCGPLQAMQIYALSTGSPWRGALSMALFALGTVPLMLASGIALNLSRGRAKRIVGKVAAVLMVLLALSMLHRGLLSLGLDPGRLLSDHKYDNYLSATVEGDLQTVEFDLEYDSYADLLLQKGIPVRITVHADESKLTGCNNEIISPDFGFDVPLAPGETYIEFTPEQNGDYIYTCWMNMIKNNIKVVDDLEKFP